MPRSLGFPLFPPLGRLLSDVGPAPAGLLGERAPERAGLFEVDSRMQIAPNPRTNAGLGAARTCAGAARRHRALTDVSFEIGLEAGSFATSRVRGDEKWSRWGRVDSGGNTRPIPLSTTALDAGADPVQRTGGISGAL